MPRKTTVTNVTLGSFKSTHREITETKNLKQHMLNRRAQYGARDKPASRPSLLHQACEPLFIEGLKINSLQKKLFTP